MDLTIGEIRILLGICVRAIRDQRESPRHFKAADRDTLHNIEIEIEEQYDNLAAFEGP